MRLAATIVLVAVLAGLQGYAAPTGLSEAVFPLELWHNAEFLVEGGSKLSEQEAWKKLDTEGKRLDGAFPNFGFTDSAVWMRIALPRSLPRRSFLTLDHIYINEIDVFLFHNGHELASAQTGLSSPPTKPEGQLWIRYIFAN